MIIRHKLPFTAYTKIDRYVIENPNISDGAKILYCYLCGMKNGSNFRDNYIVEKLGISKPVLARRKSELKKAELILVDKIDMRTYVIYIGNSKVDASEVKRSWGQEDTVI